MTPTAPASTCCARWGGPTWVEMQIVDPASGDVVPVGAVGEVWLRAPNVMAGYFRRPAETEAALTADGWLRTGDGGYVDDEEATCSSPIGSRT